LFAHLTTRHHQFAINLAFICVFCGLLFQPYGITAAAFQLGSECWRDNITSEHSKSIIPKWPHHGSIPKSIFLTDAPKWMLSLLHTWLWFVDLKRLNCLDLQNWSWSFCLEFGMFEMLKCFLLTSWNLSLVNDSILDFCGCIGLVYI